MHWNRNGVTREVFVTKRHAIKIPKLVHGWRHFLQGLLANMQEREFAATGWPELCPVTFSIPGGWALVMPRVDMLTDAEWCAFDAAKFCDTPDYVVPAEAKQDSFGKLNGRIVAIDYGN